MEKRDLNKLEEYYKGRNFDSEYIEKMFENGDNEPALRNSLSGKWDKVLFQQTQKQDLRHILHRIHFTINSNRETMQKSESKELYRLFSNVAVIIVIPLLAISIWFLIDTLNQPVQYSEIIAPKGEKAQFILPDGSTGYLNSGSKLKYAYPFTNERMVTLNGEAYFNVVHDKSEFVVQTRGMNVKVHGTRFNICAYHDEQEVITTLEEGSVSVVRNVDGRGLLLKPGQQATFKTNNQEMFYKKVDVDLYVSWKDNMLRFQNTPFIDVVRKMERWYDIKIILEENLKYTQRYTMTIKTESLREMLELMMVTTPMKYEIKEDIVYITDLKD